MEDTNSPLKYKSVSAKLGICPEIWELFRIIMDRDHYSAWHYLGAVVEGVVSNDMGADWVEKVKAVYRRKEKRNH
jgi:hypothetical protein